ncbi:MULTISPECIES: hypothetical protein [Sphingobacterium]|uniref:hypothetical protein n=1 Tax=Sphingobacterium TaxID=28453 RepID=UPI0010540A24|nr:MULTISPECIES: hypothetical protein [Sphingobacterium]MCW2259615.1 hypothetical protein [Sphingobacterium kitahiroshimense]TCR13942.1 hypothetical protein EDF67_10145 [Sphingobacterium sp. JUb78]
MRNKRENKEERKNKELSEYPVIYSYIYEREIDDIKRLADQIKTIKSKIKALPTNNKTIIRYTVEDGKVVPVYEE